jgi:uncharacterized protein YbjT (DUF2867 family)
MKILICGASGFVGRNLTNRLRAAGFTVLRGVRHAVADDEIAMDFYRDTDPAVWLPRLHGVSVVINAVGILRDTRSNPMWQVHGHTPQALFAAAQEAGVARVVHISALGVDSGMDVIYFNSKLLAEQALQNLPSQLPYLCLRPSVIYGEDGASAQLFRLLAKLPIHALPEGGRQRLQPVHIQDIAAAIIVWLQDNQAASQTVAAVGAEATDMRGMLYSYRAQMAYQPAWHIAVPSMMVKLAARLGDALPASPLCSDTLAMLNSNNTADVTEFAQLLGRLPKSYRHFITPAEMSE